jgi:RNA polymerase sigma-70 factor (ECF subfamily)
MDETNIHAMEAGYFAAHRDELMRFATAVAGVSDAQDVVSQAMMKLISNGALRDAPSPRALMYRTVLNETRSMQRSGITRRRRERATANAIVARDPEIRPDVVAAVLRLSPQQRACVWLTYWADMPVADTADHLGISEGTVKNYLSRARDHLKEVLDE